MRIKTSELIGPALNWAVAHCEGLNPNTDPEVRRRYVGYAGFAEANGFGYAIRQYSTDWAQGGPIIDRERITISQGRDLIASIWIDEYGVNGGYKFKQTGPTPLIAAMRTFVASKLGDEVDVPEELL